MQASNEAFLANINLHICTSYLIKVLLVGTIHIKIDFKVNFDALKYNNNFKKVYVVIKLFDDDDIVMLSNIVTVSIFGILPNSISYINLYIKINLHLYYFLTIHIFVLITWSIHFIP